MVMAICNFKFTASSILYYVVSLLVQPFAQAACKLSTPLLYHSIKHSTDL